MYWRALDGGRALYKSALMRPQGKWDDDSFWNPQTGEDRKLAQRFTAGLTPAKREEIHRKLDLGVAQQWRGERHSFVDAVGQFGFLHRLVKVAPGAGHGAHARAGAVHSR